MVGRIGSDAELLQFLTVVLREEETVVVDLSSRWKNKKSRIASFFFTIIYKVFKNRLGHPLQPFYVKFK